MTDRELLVQIYGAVVNAASYSNEPRVKKWIEDHFNKSPTPERLSLESRVKSLERIVTSRGYQIDEELEKMG